MLNDAFIRSIKPPPTGQKSYSDDQLPGFALRVSQGGTKTFVLVYGRDRHRVTIGRYGIISLASARHRAREILAEITLGTHKPKSLTFGEAAALFREIYLPQNRASTAKETSRLLDKAARKFGNIPLSECNTPHLAAFLDRTTEKAHVHTALATLFNWSVRRGYIEQNPMSRLQKERVRPRDRALSPPELASVLRASENLGRYGQLIRFLIYTGQRLGQAHALTEAHIDRDKMTLSWPSFQMKTNRPHSIPYGPLTAELIGSLWAGNWHIGSLFTKTERYHARLVKAAGVEWFTRGDLRRTWRTTHAMIGSMPHIAERLMAHSVGNSVQQVYERYSYLPEMRQACEKYEAYLSDLVARTS